MLRPTTPASYEILRLLGEGGVGRVYEATHHPSNRHVAIKTLRSEHGGPTSQRLLLNEAAAVAQIAHPAIVELLDVGRDDYGGMFLVMELVRGSNLEAWSQTFPGLRTVLVAACDILDALATAHAQGIIHGDLKPANVLLTEEGKVKITDFGIAHVIDPLHAPKKRRGLQGTPYYMAPEQLADTDAIGPPTDLYAVGMMLYELIAGREPYASTGTLGELLARKMVHIRPLEPRPGLETPAELVPVVMSLLDPDPRLRPRFAAAVRSKLAAIVSDARVRDVVLGPLRAEEPFATGPTITSSGASSGELPANSTSAQSVPFSLPCIAASPEVALHRLRPLPMLGRDAQAHKLLELVEGAAKGGARGIVVGGRAGEGKTRLLRYGFAEVERTGRMIGAAASFDETIAHEAVGTRACMRRLLGATGPTAIETLAARWRWLAAVPQPDVDFDLIHAWLSSDARAFDQPTTVHAASMCVLAASRVHPVYLWLDDVAWSRDGAMDLMARLLERNEARVLVAGTMRSGTAEHPAVRAWLLRLAAAGAELMMLPPLSEPERVALLEAAGPVQRDVARALAKKLDEPALVLVEAVRSWIADELLVPVLGSDAYTLRRGASVDELAAGATAAVVGGRISALVDAFGADRVHAERVLCHAALLGLRFEEEALRKCADATWVDRVLDRALLTGLLRVDGRRAYRFEHRAFLDVIVERCAARPDAAVIFRTTADALVDIYGPRNTATGLAAAQLYQTGGELEKAARTASDVIRSMARAAMFDAAERALALFASWVAALPAEHLHRALHERAKGARHYFSMDYPRARQHLHAAREAFERLGARADLQDVLVDISSTHFYQDHFAESERYVRLVDVTVARWWARGLVHQRLSELSALRLDLASAVTHQRAALEGQGAVERHFQTLGTSTLVELLIASGDLHEAGVMAAKLTELVNTAHDTHLVADAERTLAAFDAARGQFAQARARLAPRVAQLVVRKDAWHLTADLGVLALCSAAIDRAPETVTEAVRAFIGAYRAVPHDEVFTWWTIRSTQAYLRGRGMDALADELGAMLDDRLDHISRAFADEEPITEDVVARSGAETRASSR